MPFAIAPWTTARTVVRAGAEVACFPRRSKRACTTGAVMDLALGMVVSVTTDVPLAPEAGLLLGALRWPFSRQGA